MGYNFIITNLVAQQMVLKYCCSDATTITITTAARLPACIHQMRAALNE